MNTPRVVVVTGASAGLGRSIAHEFAREGAKLSLIARNEEGLRGAQKEVAAAGGEAIFFPVDVVDAGAVELVAEETEQRLGPIDVWVNNAMVSVFSPVHEMTPPEYRRVTEVNYLGYVHGTLAALTRMRPRNQGLIIQVGSALAYRSIPLQSAYCASKHAINGFTESLRTELLHDRSRVQVVSVHMPALNTTQFEFVKSRLPRKPQPVPPIFQPEVGARAVVWASHHPQREYWVGRSTVKAIVGDMLAPGYADRYLARHGYDWQQTSEPADPSRKHNLWNPIPGDHGSHGRFDSRAVSWSPQFWLRTHGWKWLGFALVGGAGLAAWTFGRARSGDARSGERIDVAGKSGAFWSGGPSRDFEVERGLRA
ncbi:MAG: SDR family oxidoreductase [Bdellovibrionales bacterium]